MQFEDKARRRYLPSLYKIHLRVFEERLPFLSPWINYGKTHLPNHSLPYTATPVQLLHPLNHRGGLLVYLRQLHASDRAVHKVVYHWLNLRYRKNSLTNNNKGPLLSKIVEQSLFVGYTLEDNELFFCEGECKLMHGNLYLIPGKW